RKEGVVDVDDAARHLRAQLLGEDLHVTGQHHQVHVIAVDQLEQPGFLFLLGLRGDGQVVKVHSVGLGEELQVGVVGDHGDDVCVQQSAALAVQQIVETVTEFGHHDDRAWPLTTQVEVPFDGRPGRAATEVGGQ